MSLLDDLVKQFGGGSQPASNTAAPDPEQLLLAQYGDDRNLQRGATDGTFITPSSPYDGKPKPYFYGDDTHSADFVIDPAKDARVQKCVIVAHRLRDQYPPGSFKEEWQREAFFAATLDEIRKKEFGEYNPAVAKEVRREEELNKQREEGTITHEKWVAEINKLNSAPNPNRPGLEPAHLEKMAKNCLVCAEEGPLMGYLMAEGGIPNSVVIGHVTYAGGASGYHAYVVSAKTGNIIEATADNSRDVYQRTMNGVALEGLKHGQTAIVQGANGSLAAYGTGAGGSGEANTPDYEWSVRSYDKMLLAPYVAKQKMGQLARLDVPAAKNSLTNNITPVEMAALWRTTNGGAERNQTAERASDNTPAGSAAGIPATAEMPEADKPANPAHHIPASGFEHPERAYMSIAAALLGAFVGAGMTENKKLGLIIGASVGILLVSFLASNKSPLHWGAAKPGVAPPSPEQDNHPDHTAPAHNTALPKLQEMHGSDPASALPTPAGRNSPMQSLALRR